MANSRLKKLINYLIPHKKQLWIGVFALLVVNTLGVYIPILIRDTINDLQAGFTLDTIRLLCHRNSRISFHYVGHSHDF
jgi:ATP-binding cassette, subfamily B, multidrug efflux pump